MFGGIIARLSKRLSLSCGILLVLASNFPIYADTAPPDAVTIIQRSVAALRADWKAAPQYNYHERDLENHITKTYEVMMILGSPYQRLVAINGTQLSAKDQKVEQRKLDHVIAKRRRESKRQTENRIAEYQDARHRDHRN